MPELEAKVTISLKRLKEIIAARGNRVGEFPIEFLIAEMNISELVKRIVEELEEE